MSDDGLVLLYYELKEESFNFFFWTKNIFVIDTEGFKFWVFLNNV